MRQQRVQAGSELRGHTFGLGCPGRHGVQCRGQRVRVRARLGTIEPVRALGAGLGACWPDVAGRTAALPRHDVAGGAVLARTLLPTLRSVPALLAPAAARAPAVT